MPRDVDAFFSKAHRLAATKKSKSIINFLWGVSDKVERGVISEAKALDDMRQHFVMCGLSPMDVDMAYMQASSTQPVFGSDGSGFFESHEKKKNMKKSSVTGIPLFDIGSTKSNVSRELWHGDSKGFNDFNVRGLDKVGIVGFAIPSKKKKSVPKLNMKAILWGVGK